jgi:hypothetical protein
MTEQMIEKRNILRTISNAAIEAAKSLNINPDEYKVNDLIMLFVYNPKDKYIFDSFLGWKLKGYTVKRGAKAYLLWGQPLNKTRVNKATGQEIQGNDDDHEAPFFPLAYLFRDDQVRKPDTTKNKAHKHENKPSFEPAININFDV